MKRLLIIALLIVGCGSTTPSVVPSAASVATPRPTMATASPTMPAPTTPAPVASASPEPTDTEGPADGSLVALAPTAVRDACRSIDLSDAPAEIDCKSGDVDFYLERWPTLAGVETEFTEMLEAQECATLDTVRGTYLAGKVKVGEGGGCADGPEFSFTVERERLYGVVTVLSGTLADSQAWFKANRPIGKIGGSLTGAALGPAVAGLDWAGLVAHAKKVPYRTFFRDAETYEGKLVYFKAKVLQVTDDGALVEVTKDKYGFWSDLVFLTYTSSERILDDDLIEFVGTGASIHTYTTVQGASKDVPQVDAITVRIR